MQSGLVRLRRLTGFARIGHASMRGPKCRIHVLREGIFRIFIAASIAAAPRHSRNPHAIRAQPKANRKLKTGRLPATAAPGRIRRREPEPGQAGANYHGTLHTIGKNDRNFQRDRQKPELSSIHFPAAGLSRSPLKGCQIRSGKLARKDAACGAGLESRWIACFDSNAAAGAMRIGAAALHATAASILHPPAPGSGGAHIARPPRTGLGRRIGTPDSAPDFRHIPFGNMRYRRLRRAAK
ncbi:MULTISPECIES: hypothetical protein [Cupriavidus]